MAKSSYLFKLLSVAVVCFCSYAGSINVAAASEHQESFRSLDSRQLRKVNAIYDREVGIRETGYNSGARIEEYLKYVNAQKGQPWCAAFVSWVFGQAGFNRPRTASAADLMQQGKIIQIGSSFVAQARPQKGDVFGIWFPKLKRVAHAGFVDQWGSKWVITVEGNTNNAVPVKETAYTEKDGS